MANAKPLTKSEIFKTLAESTSLSRGQVATVFTELEGLIKKQVSRNGPGVFTLPGLLKIDRRKIPAKPARMGRNPATGEPIKIAAKPATTKIRVRALKNLKALA